MSHENKNQLSLTITQDKLLDFLMHAATREDIAKLDKKIESLANKMDTRFDRTDVKYDIRFNKLETKVDRLMWGIFISVLVPIALKILPEFVK